MVTKITFINDLAEKAGAIVQEVARGIGMDIRIGSKFLHARPEFGGSCFPEDARALIKTYRIMTRLLGFTDDMREARSIPLITALQHMGAAAADRIRMHGPLDCRQCRYIKLPSYNKRGNHFDRLIVFSFHLNLR